MAESERVYKPAVGPRLRRLLQVVFLLFAVLLVNSAYLTALTLTQWVTGDDLQGSFYLWMFLAHLVLGTAIIVPVVCFGAAHMRSAWNRPNQRAARVGLVLFGSALLLLLTGVLLTRVEVWGVVLGVRDGATREWLYWLHALLPLGAIWLFILHRLAGRRIRWSVGAWWGLAALGLAGLAVALHTTGRGGTPPSPRDGERYFEPSLARTATGGFIPARSLLMNDYCIECHADAYESWSHSMHALSSFNNPPYAFSVRNTRHQAFLREGSVKDSRFCAGCHDPVPFFTGQFEDPRFDDPQYDLASDPHASAGLTCTSCHSIIAADGVRGNGAYTIEESPQYPFTFSESPLLRWVNRQLVKAKPQFHKRTFLKPEVHKGAEFCSTCHKVFLPEEVNDYKWLRGQDHYDSFRLGGVSGHGIQAWYWPAQAKADCAACHMTQRPSDDIGAKVRDGALTTLDHQFAAANTATALLAGTPDPSASIDACVRFVTGVARVDIVALLDGMATDAPLRAPLGEVRTALRAGNEYILDVITRNLGVGHALTQGTADSNEVWLDCVVEMTSARSAVPRGEGESASAPDEWRVIGRSGGFGAANEVDRWAKFLNIFMLDRAGNRIERRNPEDIFVALYDHQVPPGAADLTRYRLRVPDEAAGDDGAGARIRVTVSLRYRKFDAIFLQHIYGAGTVNNLPVLTLAQDRVEFQVAEPIRGASAAPAAPAASMSPAASSAPATPSTPASPTASIGDPQPGKPDSWERMSDYGIGLLRLGEGVGRKGDFRGAERAFGMVEAMGRSEGPLGLARVYLREGRVSEAGDALNRAETAGAARWSVLYFIAQVQRQVGNLTEAFRSLDRVRRTDWSEARSRGFDFSKDDRLLVELAQVQYELARLERGNHPDAALDLLSSARTDCESALQLDPESVAAWHTLALIADDLGDSELAGRAREAHARYKPNENARDTAINAARIRYPAADHAAEPSAIYDLHREGAPVGDVNAHSVGPCEELK